jgi:peptide/nickel transport system permease protein
MSDYAASRRVESHEVTRVPRLGLRQKLAVWFGVSLAFLIIIILLGSFADKGRISSNLLAKNMSPSIAHPFGTDWLGRDMFTRTVMGLMLSIRTGMVAALFSAMIAAVFGVCAATLGEYCDNFVTWFIDLFLGIPHIVLLILISIALGGGVRGISIGVALTHWPHLSRVVRAEVMQLRNMEYIHIARQLGKGWLYIATKHIFPHILPQLMVGLILLFPHAILHEASITFLGYGLDPTTPAIGIILSESMRYLSAGMWWLAFFPGLMLVLVVRLFDIIGDTIRQLLDPHLTQL